MIYAVMFLAVPFAIYLATALAPPGRALALVGGGAAVILAVLWTSWMLTLPPLFTGENAADGLTGAAVVVLTIAVGLGLCAQGFRRVLPGRRPRWLYPAIVTLTAVAAGLPMLAFLGI